MAFGDELVNVESSDNVGGESITMQSSVGVPVPAVAARNANALAHALTHLQRTGGGIIFFPPGRYYVSSPDSDHLARMRMVATLTPEAGGDFVVGDLVTLWFSPGATLVPMTVGSGASARKVRIEIRGYVDAGVHQIFDVMLHPVNISPDAGEVIFTRSGVRQVYPEWWGAVPAPPDFESVNEAAVRRTTKALQAAIDAAHALPNLQWTPIPIVLTNDYVVDDELVVGIPQSDVLTPRTPAEAALRPRNGHGVVMRGARGPSDNRDWNVRIIASPRSQAFLAPGQDGDSSLFGTGMAGRTPTATDPTPYGTRSILGLRSSFGFSVENITFDASFSAMRCVTVEDLTGGVQQCGFQGCCFRNARSELVHLGGEFQPVPEMLRMPKFETFLSGEARHWHGNQDLSNMRFLRCRFETDPEGRVDRATARRMRVTNLVGVVSRAAQSLGVEFRGCVFRGQANPMIHALGSRFSLEHCHFRTTEFDDGVRREGRKDPVYGPANGADVFIDNPPADVYPIPGGRDQGVVTPASLTARDVFSGSVQFLVTFTDERRAFPSQSSTVLHHVRHHPPEGSTRPSVYWNGPGRIACPLILMGCDMPADGVHLAGGFNAPVIDLGNHVRGAGGLFSSPPGVHVIVQGLRTRFPSTSTLSDFHGP